jgi:hypothetical protein
MVIQVEDFPASARKRDAPFEASGRHGHCLAVSRLQMRGLFRVHRTPQGLVDCRAFRLEHAAYRAEVQRHGDPLSAVPGATFESLEEAWESAERRLMNYFPHDCTEMGCSAPPLLGTESPTA